MTAGDAVLKKKKIGDILSWWPKKAHGCILMDRWSPSL